MTIEKKLYVIVITLFLNLVSFGSSFGEPYKISEYFPINTDNRWEYTTGVRYFTNETYTNLSGHTGQLYATDTYEYAMFIKNSETGFMVVGKYERPENDFSDFPDPLILIPETMVVGETYNTTFYSDTITTTLEAKETITVPAGEFETIRYKITVVNDEQESVYTYVWFAKDIGIIKIDREDVYPSNSGCIFVCRPDNNYALVNAPAELISAEVDGKIYQSDETTQHLVSEIYVATFGRAPAYAGLTYWTNAVETGDFTIEQVAQSFFDQPETKEKFPEGSSNSEFISTVFYNVLNRAPTDSGLAYWVDALDRGLMRRDQAVMAIINGAKATTGSSDDAATLAKKTEIGVLFASSDVGSMTDNESFMDWATNIISFTASDDFNIEEAEDYIVELLSDI